MTCGRGRGGENGGGIVEGAERIEEFFFTDATCSSSIFCRICLFDQGYVVYHVFHCGFQNPCCSVFTTTIKEYGSDRLPNIIFVRFCDFCSPAAFAVTHLSLHSLSLHGESKLDSSLPNLFIIFLLFLWQAGELSRLWHQPGEHHGYHCSLQPASRKQQFNNGQRTRSSLQYATFRYPAKCKLVTEILFRGMNTVLCHH